jgi:hypothetical protein
MKTTRLASLISVVVLAASLIAATTALASAPEFNPGTLTRYVTITGLVLQETPTGSPLHCQGSEEKGEIVGKKKRNVELTYFNCHSNEGGGCSVKGGGAGTGKILTNTLDGELGSVKTNEAPSGVGLVLLPTSGTEFATLEGSCLLVNPSSIDGAIAEEISPVNGAASTTGKATFTGLNGSQSIKKINVLGTVIEPKLLSLGLLETSESARGEVTYETAVTVT